MTVVVGGAGGLGLTGRRQRAGNRRRAALRLRRFLIRRALRRRDEHDFCFLRRGTDAITTYVGTYDAPMKGELAACYVRRGAFLTGHFELTGGGTSDFYIDGRLIATYPPALRLIARMHAALIAEHDLLPDDGTLVGPALGAVPIVTALGLELDRPFVIDRGKAKGHGTGKRFEGAFCDGARCLIVEDLITVGSTLLDTVRALREQGRDVTDALVTVDRQEGGPEAAAAEGVRVHALLTQADLRAAVAR
jgi:orotate phosphoribosyltransferase